MRLSLGKRLLSLLLAAVMVLGLLPAVTILEAEAETTSTASASTVTRDEIIALRNYAETLGWPVASKVTNLSTSTTMTGYWTILVQRGTTQEMYTSNGDAKASAIIENNDVDPFKVLGVSFVTSKGVVAEIHNPQRSWILCMEGTGSSFTIKNHKNQYWNIYNDGNGSSKPLNNFDLHYGGASNFVISNRNGGYALQTKIVYNSVTYDAYVNANSYSFQADNTLWSNPIYFYKYNTYTMNLRMMMLDALPYLIDNSDGRFDTTAHNSLLAAMEASVEAYRTHYDTAEASLSSEAKTLLTNCYNDFQSALTAVKNSDKGDPLAALRSKIAGATWPMAERITDINKITTGYWLILTNRGDTTNGDRFALNPDTEQGGWHYNSDSHTGYGTMQINGRNYYGSV